MDYYDQLNIPRSASTAEIRARLDLEFKRADVLFEQFSRRAESDARRQHLQTIGDTLLKPGTRAQYDAYLSSLGNENHTRRIGFALPGAADTRAGGVDQAVTASAYCNECGQPVRTTARFCSSCGTKLELGSRVASPTTLASTVNTWPEIADPPGLNTGLIASAVYCNRCGKPLLSTSATCTRCSAIPSPDFQSVASAEIRLPRLSTYYQDEFRRIDESRELYKGKWNWAAFLFGPLWALTKGLWLSALIAIIGGLFTGGVIAVVYWFIFGARGNYLYYCQAVRKRQLPF